MFQLRHLKTFLAAAETLSFTQAAERVHLSQPSVTEQIRALEDSLGRPLFLRRNNRLALTEAGEALLPRARDLLALADQVLHTVRDGADVQAEGELRLAAPAALCAGLLAPLLAAYAEARPRVRVRLLERHSQGTAQAVTEGEADLGLVHGWLHGSAAYTDLQVEVVAHDRPRVLLPAGHALAAAGKVTPQALATQPLLLTTPGCSYRRYLEGLLQQAAVRPVVRAEADDVPSLLRLVAQGLGVSVLPARAIALAAVVEGVVDRPLAGAAAGLPICVLARPRETQAAPARPAAAFLALLRAHAAPSDEPVPALDVQYRAGGVAVAEEEQDRVRDVLGRAHAADRQLPRH